MGFQWVKNAVPAAVGIEDRHVEHKHWIVPSLVTAKFLSPPVLGICFSFSKQLPICLIVRVHWFCFLVN